MYIIKNISERDPNDKFDYSAFQYYGKDGYNKRNKLRPFYSKTEALKCLFWLRSKYTSPKVKFKLEN